MSRPSEVAASFVPAISRHDPDAVAACFAELARRAGGIEAQLARMTGDEPPA